MDLRRKMCTAGTYLRREIIKGCQLVRSRWEPEPAWAECSSKHMRHTVFAVAADILFSLAEGGTGLVCEITLQAGVADRPGRSR